jgi:hypothetical protein
MSIIKLPRLFWNIFKFDQSTNQIFPRGGIFMVVVIFIFVTSIWGGLQKLAPVTKVSNGIRIRL